MRALRFEQFGDPSRLALVELPDPRPAESTAVVRIRAASVNQSDVKNVAGQMEGTVLPRIPGRDFSGVVESGPAEWLGAEVWRSGGDIGFTADGTHAERIGLPVAALVRKPRNLSHEAASAVGVTFIVAWLGLVAYAEARAGETVVVIGAGGGAGGAAAQIARARGCRVIGVDRGAALPPAAAQSVDEFVSSDGDLVAGIHHATGGAGAPVIFDAVGGVMFEPAVRALAHRGRLVEISAIGRRRVEFDLVDFYHREGRILGADSRKLDAVASARVLERLVGDFEQGVYHEPSIARRYPLAEGITAYRAVAEGARGRVVLTM